jgi:hypothetical protein
MVRRKAETFAPVTMGHIRGHGCRDLLVYCNSGRCHHSATMNADWLSDETPVDSRPAQETDFGPHGSLIYLLAPVMLQNENFITCTHKKIVPIRSAGAIGAAPLITRDFCGLCCVLRW